MDKPSFTLRQAMKKQQFTDYAGIVHSDTIFINRNSLLCLIDRFFHVYDALLFVLHVIWCLLSKLFHLLLTFKGK